MLNNPTCGYPLKNGSKIIALIDLLVGILLTAYLVYILVSGYPGTDESAKNINNISDEAHNGTATNVSENHKILFGYIVKKLDRIILILMYAIAEGWLFIVLLRAARKDDLHACKRWIRFRCLVLILYIIYVLFQIISGNYVTYELILECLIIIYRMYAIDVVAMLKRELIAAATAQKEGLADEDEPA
ncbi:unnamed protein product [Orchesella dallaii]|uniref:Uncharacterized protein n=1 Tax=Orchesella dallaii TaxID=48710 RepID=A0ABP1S8Y7_9HEXA